MLLKNVIENVIAESRVSNQHGERRGCAPPSPGFIRMYHMTAAERAISNIAPG
jgi:hypothetical protein